MELTLYQVDAFADHHFKGNPAAVVPLQEWLPDTLMQSIAEENNLSETAFFVPGKRGYSLRWFTPLREVDLCGHATLASAHVLYEHLGFTDEKAVFHTRSGPLMVKRKDGWYSMNLPPDQLELLPQNPLLEKALGLKPAEIFKGREDYLVVLDSEADVLALKPDFRIFHDLDGRGVIATAPGREVDFVSRCFFPKYGIDEDPVTGSAHTTLIAYWGKVIDKEALLARQASARSGLIRCREMDERVEISGQAITYMTGVLHLKD